MGSGDAQPQRPSALRQLFDIRPGEWPFATLMCLYFFLVISIFWVLKPLKKSLFIGYYDRGGIDLLGWHLGAAQAELLAKVLNMVVAFVAVAVFTAMSRTLRRQQLTYVFSGFFILLAFAYTFVMGVLGHGSVWTFYLYGDLYNTVMVATFFSFLNDSVDPDAAKRLYGPIGVGGVAGGAFGSTVLRANIDDLTTAQWLWVCILASVVVAVIAWAAGRIVARRPPPEVAKAAPSTSTPARAGNAAIEGARLVFRSRYLLSIVAIVGLYEIVSTLMDFQYTASVEHYLEGEDIRDHIASVFAVTNWVGLAVQLLAASFVMRRFGVQIALMVLPVAALTGSMAFLAAPLLLTGSALSVADNGLNYSINQSAKEVLYVPTTRQEKYGAKAFVDMFVQRFAKTIAVVLSLGLTTLIAGFSSVRLLSIASVVCLVAWIAAVRYAGRSFREKERAVEQARA